MSSLILHIGPHKTGTTAIQIALENSWQELAKQHTRFDTLKEYDGVNSHQIADLISTRRLADAEVTLKRFPATREKYIVSSENFSRLDIDGVRFLRERLSFDNVRIVYFLRNPLARMKSDWQELVKHGYRFSFMEFIGARLTRPMEDRILNDEVRIAPWREVFGSENIDIHLYDQISDAAKYFLNYYFLIDSPTPSRKINKSFDIETTEILRALVGLQKVFLTRPHLLMDDLSDIHENLCTINRSENSRYVQSCSMSMDSTIFRNIEKTILAHNRTMIRGEIHNDFLYKQRNTTWDFISTDVWLENPKLTSKLFSLRDKIIEEIGNPIVDYRLRRM